MKNNQRYRIILLLITGFFIALIQNSCKKDPVEPDDDMVSLEIREINSWIKEYMEALYLWNDKIPGGLNPNTEPDPRAFFNKMLYRAEDTWSFITPDFRSLLAELQGVPFSTGISPLFVRIGGENLMLIIEYVYPGSPADLAGLERGDLIISIDEKLLTLGNYTQLFNQESLMVGFGMISGSSIVPTGEFASIQAKVIEADPLIHYEVIESHGHKTGYMVYTGFKSGINNVFIESLDKAFSDFKSEGIQDLIVDLRYNRGGEINMAAHLASGIAPNSVDTTDVLVKYIHNSGLQEYLKSEFGEDSERLVLKFVSHPHRLNLPKVYFLTGWKTASASELVISGLDPYMQVISIGDTTVGKYTGSWVITDPTNPPKHDWAMMPIVLKYANAVGFTDFKNGLFPNYFKEELIVDLKPFGNPADPLLGTALDLITGMVAAAPKKVEVPFPYFKVEDKWSKERNLLLVPSDGLEKFMFESGR